MPEPSPSRDPMATTVRTPIDFGASNQSGPTIESRPPIDPTERTAGGLDDDPARAPGERRLGRFYVLRELGRGAMGVVFAAYDEILDRKVALKLLHVDDERDVAAARNLLLREAQALARLTHPNVVAIHECGVVAGEVYLAMEYVAGGDLKTWLAAERRSWRAIVDVFLQAGAGLLAAHGRALVHRDFKPGNVLLGDDGRVRVADFGLAGKRGHEPPEVDVSPSPRALDRTIAGVGNLVGTPAYMAPELYRHEPASPRSDQWAFCVALWEALYGQRPFLGKDSLELAALVETHDLPASPPSPDVPAWVHAVLLRGLRRDPAARFPGMGELLAALSPRPSRTRTWALGGLLTLAAAGGAAGAWSLGDPPCPDAQELRDRLWSEPRAAAIAAAFAREDLPQTGARVLARLAEHAHDWAEGAAQACVDGREAALDPRVLDVRQQCLARARDRLDDLAGALEHADAAAARHAQEQIDALPAASACRALALADLECQPLPSDPAVREAGAGGRARLDAAARRELAGDYLGAIEEVRAAVAVFDELPAVGPRIHARAHLGRLLHELEDPGASRPVLLAARDDAERLHCDAILVELYGRLIHLAAFNTSFDRGEAGAWSVLQDLRIGLSPGPLERAQVAHGRALLAFFRDNDLAAAGLAADEARAALEAAGDTSSRRYADLLRLSGLVALGRDDLDQAVALFVRGREAWVAATSPRDPVLWRFDYNLGLVANIRGDNRGAREHLQRALELAEAGLGRRSMPVAKCLVMLALIAERDGRADDTLRDSAEALAIVDSVFARDDPRRAEAVEARAEFLTTLGRAAEAVDLLRDLLELRKDAAPADLAWTHFSLARALLGRDDPAAALPHAEFAVRHGDELPGSHAEFRSLAALHLGRALLGAGRPADALAPLEQALTGLRDSPDNVNNLGLARFAFAQALCATGDRSSRPRALAEAALAEVIPTDRPPIETWLSRPNCSTATFGGPS